MAGNRCGRKWGRQEQGGCRTPGVLVPQAVYAGSGAGDLFDTGSLCGTGCAARLRFVRSLELSALFSQNCNLQKICLE